MDMPEVVALVESGAAPTLHSASEGEGGVGADRDVLARALTGAAPGTRLVRLRGTGEDVLDPALQSADVVLVTADALGNIAEAMVRLCRWAPRAAVLVVAGSSDPETDDLWLRSGAQGVLTAETGDLGDVVCLRRQIRHALARQEHVRRWQAESYTDALTGLLNRRGFDRASERGLRMCDRTSSPAALLLWDVDDLKGVNDRAGHAAGDEVLATAARSIRDALRASDAMARIGGDEFAAFAPGSTSEGALIVDRRVRDLLAAASSGPTGLSLSFGWSEYRAGSGVSLTDLMAQADRRLYDDKLRRTGQA